MSGFLKRSKTDTVNPAGGVNPALEPNVGQYGWTSYDAANVNQIIEYVNMAREAAESAKDSADYVASKFGELQSFIDYIEVIYAQIEPIFTNIEIIYKDIVLKHTEVVNLHGAAQKFSADAVAAAEAAKISEEKSLVSEHSSAGHEHNSEINKDEAIRAAQEARDIAEELRKGQVYRGTWNIEANASFPPKPDTNSVWDITLNESSVSYFFEGETWYWGDRLLYLKDDNKFSQIESGSGVISVNGKSGAVTLAAADVSAVALDGSSTMTGDLKTTRISLLNPETAIYNSEGEKVVESTKQVGANLFGNDKKDTYLVYKDNLYARKGTTDYQVYHEGFKPVYTTADIG
ncbi:MAG: hypothetical protein ACRC6V_10025, partial [Bacteroidales bacterium]